MRVLQFTGELTEKSKRFEEWGPLPYPENCFEFSTKNAGFYLVLCTFIEKKYLWKETGCGKGA